MSLKNLLPAFMTICLATATWAGTTVVQMTGVDINYDGSSITSVSNPDELTSVVIDGTAYTSAIDLDLTIPGLTGLGMTTGSSATSAAGGTLDLNVGAGTLSLALDSVIVSYIDTGSTAAFVFAATIGEILDQTLPGGAVLCEPVSVSFSTQIREMTNDGTNVTSFRSSGTGELTSVVPEPAACFLALTGMLALFVQRRRG